MKRTVVVFAILGLAVLSVRSGSVISACVAIGRWTHSHLDMHLKAPGFGLEPPKGYKAVAASQWDAPLGQPAKTNGSQASAPARHEGAPQNTRSGEGQ